MWVSMVYSHFNMFMQKSTLLWGKGFSYAVIFTSSTFGFLMKSVLYVYVYVKVYMQLPNMVMINKKDGYFSEELQFQQV